jgi:hypothetical protein
VFFIARLRELHFATCSYFTKVSTGSQAYPSLIELVRPGRTLIAKKVSSTQKVGSLQPGALRPDLTSTQL